MSSLKGARLTKSEVNLLITFVEGQSIVNKRNTDAASNRLKDKAWKLITEQFNAAITSGPRTIEQLRIKWENLKKAARKKSSCITMKKLKTEDGKYENALDRVAAILEAAYIGSAIANEGDQETDSHGGDKEESSVSSRVLNIDADSIATDESTTLKKTEKVYFNTASGIGKTRRKLIDEELKSRTVRNTSIAEYYDLKKKKLELEIEKLRLENKRLKLEIINNV